MNKKLTIEFKNISDEYFIALTKLTENIDYLNILNIAKGDVTEADNMFSAIQHLKKALAESGYTSE